MRIIKVTVVYKKCINKLLRVFEVKTVPVKEKTIFLTFDDGPEPLITEFVLNELDKYNFKATFFCKGENVGMYPNLFKLIIDKGHSVGNHTFSHIHSFKTSTDDYVCNVEKADQYINSRFFRPPWGSITLPAFLRLSRNYILVHWSLLSGDTDFDLHYGKNMERLKASTRKGDVVLFHFCVRHEAQTRVILPAYLEWLHLNGYRSDALR